MKILECTLVEFGAFKEKTFTFGEGLNVIEGGNESGKSTLLAFIKFMLYGVPRKSAGETVSERDRILSWSGGMASGRMLVDTVDGLFRIERTLRHMQNGSRDTYPETVKIFDGLTGEQVHRGEEPGEVFFGVPAHVFESTAAVGQKQCSRLHTAELGSSIENMLFTGDESLDTQRASAKLDAVRRTLLHKNGKGGRLYELQEKERDAQDRLTRARMSAAAMVDRQTRIEDLKNRSEAWRDRLAFCEETCNNFENLALLRRFTRLHDLERDTAVLREKLDAMHRDHACGDYLPDDAYLSVLRGLKQRLKTAREDRELALEQKEQAERETAVDESLARRMKHAEQVRAAGGYDHVMEQYVARVGTISRLFLPALLLTVLGVLIAALGAAGAILSLMPTALCLSLVGVGLLSLGAGVVCFVLRGRAQKTQRQLLLSFELSPSCSEKILATYLDGCLSALHRYEVAREELQDATQLLSERDRVLTRICEECVTALRRVGMQVDAEADDWLYASLDEALTKYSALAVEHEKLRREWERQDANLQELRRELAGQNEAELRAHLTAEQAKLTLEEDIGQLRTERDYLRRALADADARRGDMEKQLASLEATAEDPGMLSAKLEELQRDREDCQLRHDALVLASEALTLASTRVRRGVTPRLRAGAGMWMEKLSGGRYSSLGISGSMAITVDVDGQTRPIEALSGGTVDAAYLSLRLSLLEVLYGADRPPLLLDESLCQLDDRRAEQFLSMLYGFCAAGAQCLLFTCQAREGKICRGIGYFEHVRLGE